MAQGTVAVFEEFLLALGLGEHNLNTDTFKLGLTTSAVTPAAADADPGWAVGRTTNYSANEATPGGNYTTGGADITNTYAEAAGTATFDGADTTYAANASNPPQARWAIIYNDTDADKKAMAFVDLGSNFDMTTGDLVFAWHANGILTISIS